MRLATVCARGGSKRLPGKNTRMLHGKPLWLWTVQQAVESGCFDIIVISTDDPAVGPLRRLESHIDGDFQITRVRRPDELATDTAGKVPAIRHALLRAEELTGHTFDRIIDLDVTSPLRTLDDIRGFCAKLDTIRDGGLVSVCKSWRSPYFNQVELCEKDLWGKVDRARLVKWDHGFAYVRSQDAPVTYDLNASMSGWTRNYLLADDRHPVSFNTYIYEMPRERSWDIDDELDLEIVEFLMRKQQEAKAA